MSCEYTTRTTPSAVMYSVQKSKSFGGTKHELMDIKTQFERLKSEYGGGKNDSEKEKSDLVNKKAADELPMTPELGRKTPNLGSLRNLFVQAYSDFLKNMVFTIFEQLLLKIFIKISMNIKYKTDYSWISHLYSRDLFMKLLIHGINYPISREQNLFSIN